jgi:hypothetical protein
MCGWNISPMGTKYRYMYLVYMGNSIENQGDKYEGKGVISNKGKTRECSDRNQEEKREEKEKKKKGEGEGKGERGIKGEGEREGEG